jgi:hypothetical protein
MVVAMHEIPPLKVNDATFCPMTSLDAEGEKSNVSKIGQRLMLCGAWLYRQTFTLENPIGSHAFAPA